MPTLSSMLGDHGRDCLLYLTHPSNLPSILENGILSYNGVVKRALPHEDISNACVQYRRGRKMVFDRPLHDYVPFYLVRRNPMLCAVSRYPRAYIRVDCRVADKPGTAFSDGNAASDGTLFYQDPSDIEMIPWRVIRAGRWTGQAYPDGKRQRCAEILVPDLVETNYILDVRVRDLNEVDFPLGTRHLCEEDRWFLRPGP